MDLCIKILLGHRTWTWKFSFMDQNQKTQIE